MIFRNSRSRPRGEGAKRLPFDLSFSTCGSLGTGGISVIIPTCGRSESLRQSIRSTGQAAYSAKLSDDELEVVVVDDGYSAETSRLVGDELIRSGLIGRCQRSPGGPSAGPAVARHHGICSAQGGLIYLLDDDDQFLPNRFQKSVGLLGSGNSDVVFERSPRCYDDGSGRASYVTGPFESNLLPFEFLIAGGGPSHVTPAATAFRKSTYLACGGYDPRLRHYGEDGELLLRLCLYGRVAMLAGDPVCRISIHSSNTSRPANRDYWQNMVSLGTLHRKVRRDKERWPEAYRFLRDGGVVSGKLDFCLSQVRSESRTYAERLRRGLRVIQYFPLDCLRWNNLRTIGVWLTKGV